MNRDLSLVAKHAVVEETPAKMAAKGEFQMPATGEFTMPIEGDLFPNNDSLDILHQNNLPTDGLDNDTDTLVNANQKKRPRVPYPKSNLQTLKNKIH